MLYSNQDGNHTISAIVLVVIIVVLFTQHPIAMSIGAAILIAVVVMSRIIYTRHKERCLVNSFYKSYDERSLRSLMDLYRIRKGKHRKRIEMALDSYFLNELTIIINKTKESKNLFAFVDNIGYVLNDYYSYKPSEARKIIASRNDIMIFVLKKMIEGSCSYEKIMNVLASIERKYQALFRHKEKDIYDKFASDIYGFLLPIAEKISEGVSDGREFTFNVATPENIVGLFILIMSISLKSDGFEMCKEKIYIPYCNIPDFDNEEYEDYMPLVSDNNKCYLIKPDSIGTVFLKHILTQQRNRVSPSGPSSEIITIIDNTFKKIANDRWEQDMRRLEEEINWKRESSMLLYD